MAERLGITRSYYGELETGKKEASATLRSMIHMLDRLEGAPAHSVGKGMQSRVMENRSAFRSSKRVDEEQTSLPLNVRQPYTLPRLELAPMEKISKHLQPWLAAAEEHPDIAGFLYSQLLIHLPSDKLDILKSSIEARSEQE